MHGYNGNIETVKILIETGCNINVSGNSGDTSLSIVCRNGDMEIVKILIEAGCDVNIKNVDNQILFDYVNGEIRELHKIARKSIDIFIYVKG